MVKKSIPLVQKAREEQVHVLLCTPETLPLGVYATLYAWREYAYHLCVRLDHGKANGRPRYEPSGCHGIRTKAIEV